MKPTSIIFLVFSIILVSAGLGLCFVAKNMSEKENIPLFDNSLDENDNSVVSDGYADQDISRFSLNLSDVDVNIIGGAEEARIELFNFGQNTYDFSIAAKTVTIDNSIGLLSVLKITENGFHFDGLRHYLNMKQYSDKPKSVNIYIPADEDIKKIEISVGGGNVRISDMYSTTDYSVTVGSGTLTFDNVNTSSVVKAKVGTGDVIVNNCVISTLGAELDRGDIHFAAQSYEWYDYKLTAPLGKIFFGGVEQGGKFDFTGYAPSSSISLETGSGNIRIDSVYTPDVADEK